MLKHSFSRLRGPFSSLSSSSSSSSSPCPSLSSSSNSSKIIPSNPFSSPSLSIHPSFSSFSSSSFPFSTLPSLKSFSTSTSTLSSPVSVDKKISSSISSGLRYSSPSISCKSIRFLSASPSAAASHVVVPVTVRFSSSSSSSQNQRNHQHKGGEGEEGRKSNFHQDIPRFPKNKILFFALPLTLFSVINAVTSASSTLPPSSPSPSSPIVPISPSSPSSPLPVDINSIHPSLRFIPPIEGEDSEVAPLWRRFLAFVLDNIAISAVFQCAQVIFIGSGEWILIPFSILFNVSYEVLFLSLNNGQTPGKYAMGVQVVNDDGTPVSMKSSFFIWSVKIANIFFFIDVLLAVPDAFGQNKTLHNWMTDTVVVMPMKKGKGKEKEKGVIKGSV